MGIGSEGRVRIELCKLVIIAYHGTTSFSATRDQQIVRDAVDRLPDDQRMAVLEFATSGDRPEPHTPGALAPVMHGPKGGNDRSSVHTGHRRPFRT